MEGTGNFSDKSVHVVRPLFELSPAAEQLVQAFLNEEAQEETKVAIRTTKRIVFDYAEFAANPYGFQLAVDEVKKAFVEHPPILFNGKVGILKLDEHLARIAMLPDRQWIFNTMVNAIAGDPDRIYYGQQPSLLQWLYKHNLANEAQVPKQDHYLYTDVALHSLVRHTNLPDEEAVKPMQNPALMEAIARFKANARQRQYFAKPIDLRGYDRIIQPPTSVDTSFKPSSFDDLPAA